MSSSPGGASSRGSHRLSEASLCPRKWYLHYGMGLVPKDTPEHFLVGTLVHLGLAYYRGEQLRDMGKPPAWLLEQPSMDVALDKRGKGYPKAVTQAKALVQAYKEYWSRGDPWVPVAIEEEYSASLGELRRQVRPDSPPMPDDNERVSCRIDLVVETNGTLWAADYKTTAKAWRGRLPEWNPEGEYAIHWQFLLQTSILRLRLGPKFRGVIVERILKQEPHDFDRAVVPISRVAFMDLPNVVARQCAAERSIARDAFAAQAAGEDMSLWLPSGNWWHCYQWGSPCEYRPFCTADSADEQRRVRQQLYVVEGEE